MGTGSNVSASVLPAMAAIAAPVMQAAKAPRTGADATAGAVAGPPTSAASSQDNGPSVASSLLTLGKSQLLGS